MTESDRRFALRMIPYGVHILTTLDATGAIAATTLHWVTQTSFQPPLIAVALPADGDVYAAVQASRLFALHMLGRSDGNEAVAFTDRPARMHDGLLAGFGVKRARSGLPLLDNAVAVLECEVRAVLEFGDHHPVIAEVVEAHVRLPPLARPDRMILRLDELGDTIFYGG